MKLPSPQPATMVIRYKRFLADLILPNGEKITAHVPNTGSMKSCWGENWPTILSHHKSASRKYPYTVEMTHNSESWIGVNTSRTNHLAIEGIKNGIITELSSYETIQSEYKIGDSRIDLLLQAENRCDCLVEIKNVTLKEDINTRIASFPDSVTIRGRKHLSVLSDWVQSGKRAVMLYIVQRMDVDEFSPAISIDPKYAEALKAAMEVGVEVLCYQCLLDPGQIVVSHKLPLKKW